MLEAKFRRQLEEEILFRWPGAVIIHTDPTYHRSLPDRFVFHGRGWAALETKRYYGAPYQPNQLYYLNKLDEMSFARSVNPSNMQEVINDLERAL